MKPFIVFLILLLLLSACQIPVISRVTSRPGDVLFKDDFSDLSGNWPLASDIHGNQEIINGVYQIHVLTAGATILATPGHAFQDTTAEVDTSWLGGPVQNLIGLVCRYKDQNNFYFFVISTDGYYALGKIEQGGYSLLGQQMMQFHGAINQGEGHNHLRFDCIGNTITGIINGQVAASQEDPAFSAGEVGMVAGSLDAPGVLVSFDNFLVTKP